MNNLFITATEVYKDGRTRNLVINISTISMIKQENQGNVNNSVIYINQPRPNHVFVLETLSKLEEKLNVQR